MILFWIQCAWLSLALTGWGALMWQAIQKIPGQAHQPQEKLHYSVLCFFGCFGVIFMGAILHCLTPLNEMVFWIWTTPGVLLLFLFRHQMQPVTRAEMIFATLALLVLIGFALDHPSFGDSSLYHLQLLKWTKEEKIVFGLANIHERLGFNNMWIILNALTIPSIRPEAYLELSGVLILFFILAYFFQLQDKKIFFAAALSLWIWKQHVWFQSLGWPSPDTPAAFLCAFYLFHLVRKQFSERAFFALEVMLLCMLITTRISYFPMLAGLVFIVFSRLRVKQLTHWHIWILGVGLLFGLIWLTRGFITSGCWLFPSAKSCFPQTSWFLGAEETQNTLLWIQSWARQYPEPPAVVLQNWNWLKFWWTHYILHLSMISTALVFGAAIFLTLADRQKKNLWSFRAIMIVISLEIIFWFFSAPDPRFIAGIWIFILGLGFFGILQFVQGIFGHFSCCTLQHRVCAKRLFMVLVMATVFENTRYYFSKYPLLAARFLESDFSRVTTQTSSCGVQYQIPLQDQEAPGCWFSTLPCAQNSRPHLAEKTWGSFRLYETILSKCEF